MVFCTMESGQKQRLQAGTVVGGAAAKSRKTGVPSLEIQVDNAYPSTLEPESIVLRSRLQGVRTGARQPEGQSHRCHPLWLVHGRASSRGSGCDPARLKQFWLVVQNQGPWATADHRPGCPGTGRPPATAASDSRETVPSGNRPGNIQAQSEWIHFPHQEQDGLSAT